MISNNKQNLIEVFQISMLKSNYCYSEINLSRQNNWVQNFIL